MVFCPDMEVILEIFLRLKLFAIFRCSPSCFLPWNLDLNIWQNAKNRNPLVPVLLQDGCYFFKRRKPPGFDTLTYQYWSTLSGASVQGGEKPRKSKTLLLSKWISHGIPHVSLIPHILGLHILELPKYMSCKNSLEI